MTYSNDNVMYLKPATSCNFGRNLAGCDAYISISYGCECKSNDGIIYLDYTQSVQDLIAARQHTGTIPSKPSIKWPKAISELLDRISIKNYQ